MNTNPHPPPLRRPHPHPLSLPPLPAKAHQCGSARPFRAGISTLISHLWRSNELRLLIHLWDPADYQTGRPTICQWRGVAFMLLTLPERRAETKQRQKREDQKIKWKQLTAIASAVIHTVLDKDIIVWFILLYILFKEILERHLNNDVIPDKTAHVSIGERSAVMCTCLTGTRDLSVIGWRGAM